MQPGQKAKCQTSSTTTKRNLRDDIMLAVRYSNDLETREPLSKGDSRTGLVAFHIQLPQM